MKSISKLQKRIKVLTRKILHRPLYFDGDWSDMESVDQRQIIMVLSELDLERKNIFHVGVGNSKIASLFCKKIKLIDGITIVKAEKQYAESLNVANYKVYLKNKYRRFEMPNKYDIIIDNNLTSYACCYKHFADMMKSYIHLLKSNGFMITGKSGLEYHSRLAFGYNFDKATNNLESKLPIKFSKINETVYKIQAI